MDSKYEEVEIRCDKGPRELLMKLQKSNTPIEVDEWNLMVLHCKWCSRTSRREDSSVKRVVHLYNFIGELIESRVERF